MIGLQTKCLPELAGGRIGLPEGHVHEPEIAARVDLIWIRTERRQELDLRRFELLLSEMNHAQIVVRIRIIGVYPERNGELTLRIGKVSGSVVRRAEMLMVERDLGRAPHRLAQQRNGARKVISLGKLDAADIAHQGRSWRIAECCQGERE